jgi:hypothetical protein
MELRAPCGNIPLAASKDRDAGSAVQSAGYLGIPPLCRINAGSGLAGNSEELAKIRTAGIVKTLTDNCPGLPGRKGMKSLRNEELQRKDNNYRYFHGWFLLL